MMETIKNLWRKFKNRFPGIAQFLVFFMFSNAVTVLQYLMFTFLPGWFGLELAGTQWYLFPAKMSILGVDFNWSLLGTDVLRNEMGEVIIGGGLGYFLAYELGTFIAQCINFPLQRNITYKSHGNVLHQAMWYFIAWVLISVICNGLNNLWMPVAAAYLPLAVYNILVTVITGGVSMLIFFFVFKIIFPEGEGKKRESADAA